MAARISPSKPEGGAEMRNAHTPNRSAGESVTVCGRSGDFRELLNTINGTAAAGEGTRARVV